MLIFACDQINKKIVCRMTLQFLLNVPVSGELQSHLEIMEGDERKKIINSTLENRCLVSVDEMLKEKK